MIRDKINLIILLLNSMKEMLISKISTSPTNLLNQKSFFEIRIIKMNRLFFFSDNKIFSFQFPFKAKESDNYLKFYHNNYEIDNKTISIMLSLFLKFNNKIKDISFLYSQLDDLICDYEMFDSVEQLQSLILFLL